MARKHTLSTLPPVLRAIVERINGRGNLSVKSIVLPDTYSDSFDRRLIDRVGVHVGINFGTAQDQFIVEGQFRLDDLGQPFYDACPNIIPFDPDGNLELRGTNEVALIYASQALASIPDKYHANVRAVAAWSDKGLVFELLLNDSVLQNCWLVATWTETFDILAHVRVDYERKGKRYDREAATKSVVDWVTAQIESGDYVPDGLREAVDAAKSKVRKAKPKDVAA